MSFSFTVRGANKPACRQEVVNELDAITQVQPIHAKDVEPILAAVDNHLALLGDPGAEQEAIIHVSGWLAVANDVITSASFSVGVSLAQKPEPIQHVPV